MKPPRATYRLQLSKDFDFDAAAAIAPYLAMLGVSHVYASPYLKARPGSTHGYDVVDHAQLNPELGGEAAFRRMLDAFAAGNLKQIVDFVPNHMGVGGADNPLWLDVLEWGPQSLYAGWFDIDWEPDRRYLTEKLLVPVLGGQYGVELDDGKLVLRFDAATGEFAVWAYDTHKLPIHPLEYARILGDAHPQLERLGDDFSALMEWRPQVPRRAAELKRELAQLIGEDDRARACLEESLARFNGGERRELDALIQAQFWRAAHFRVAGDDINYRRFFNINDLAGLRIELPDVFEHVHRLLFRLLREGAVDGVRIDHIDGLLDPKGYLERLRATAFGAEPRPFYLVVEKILAPDEPLHEDWPIQGTTGYEFGNLVLGLMTDPAGEASLTRGYREIAGEHRSLPRIVRECKIFIMKNEMASELNVLARDAARVARQNAHTADFTRYILHRAIRELIACFPVYRTYLSSSGDMSNVERKYLSRALQPARRNEGELDPSVFDFLESLLTGGLVAQPRSGFSRQSVLRCAMKFQQYSGPVMAKGLEDTAFYRYNRLIALNEVGGDPDCFGVSLEKFHAANLARARRWPHAMLATSTHDSKRGEDARARLIVLAEVADEWLAQVRTWRELLSPIDPAAGPDRNDQYLFYQLLLAAWPAELTGLTPDQVMAVEQQQALASYRDRIQAAMLKSIREAKQHSTWAAPREAYEAAAMRFIDSAFESREFLEQLLPFQERVARLGVDNSLVQTALKLTVPGMPDLYQGAELWDLSLVDPDNRRPVDYASRARLLEETLQAWRSDPLTVVQELLGQWRSGAIKLLLTALLLHYRSEREALFAEGGYEPCIVDDAGQRVYAFLRRQEQEAVLVVASRFPLGRDRDPSWRQAHLQVPREHVRRAWRDLLTGRSYGPGMLLGAGELLDLLPVAVLVHS